MKVYRIRGWKQHFENNRTRVISHLSWVPVPNKHDGEGYKTIMSEPDGLEIYGCWHLILQVASKCNPRGTLVRDDGTPHTARSIAVKTSCGNQKAVQRALDFCSSADVAWIDVVIKESASACHQPDVDLTSAYHRTEQNRTEQKEQNTEIDAPAGAATPAKQTFQKPTLEQVKQYGLEIQMLTTDAEAFFDHFETTGWRLSAGRGGMMKDWHAALRRWKRNQRNFAPATGAAKVPVSQPLQNLSRGGKP